jgi:hypothetical protein
MSTGTKWGHVCLIYRSMIRQSATVARVQTCCHLWLLLATITHGPILLSGPLKSLLVLTDPLEGYCVESRPSHLILEEKGPRQLRKRLGPNIPGFHFGHYSPTTERVSSRNQRARIFSELHEYSASVTSGSKSKCHEYLSRSLRG